MLSSALIVFSRKGYAATTLNDIACEAGLTRGAVYWHFKDKADLYINMVEHYFNNIKAFISPPNYSQNSPLNMLRELMYKRLIIVTQEKDIRNLVEILRYKTEVKLEGKLLEAQQKIDRYFWDETHRIVQRGIETQEIRNDLDTAFVTTAILSYINGIEDTWLFNANLFSLEEYLPGLITLFLESIVKK